MWVRKGSMVRSRESRLGVRELVEMLGSWDKLAREVGKSRAVLEGGG